MARPTKLTATVLSAINKVIETNILFCTDEELVSAIDEILPEGERFSYDSFSKWKRGESQSENPLFQEFLRLIKKALVKEKTRLLKKLENDDKAWQKYAWILERKFDEWNIRNKSEVEANIKIPNLPDITIT
jgi:hypothetical protein